MEYEFEIKQPFIKALNTQVILTSWKDSPRHYIRPPQGMRGGAWRSTNIEYVIQWPWQWFYKWQIKRTKLKLIKRYIKFKHHGSKNRGTLITKETVNSEDLI